MARKDIEASFPALAAGGYKITSASDAGYNCAAWAAADSHRWWDPAPDDGYYWPPNISRTLSLSNLAFAFGTLGYERCDNGASEAGFEKLALYADQNGFPTHVARQLPSGAWTSKLGVSEDIEHATLEGLEGPLYGKVVQFMRRAVPTG